MMRYALRNKDKIAKVLGSNMLNRIVRSLDVHFMNSKTIEINEESENIKYLVISDVDHTVNIIIFYVLLIKYDVYRLAFKEFAG